MRKLVLGVALLLLFTQALAQANYAVDSAGGPLTLPEDVEAAFLDWFDAGVEAVPAERDPAENLFRFAHPDLLGPDTVTLTLQRQDDRPQLEIVIHPDLYRHFPAALHHEAGLLLGLTPQPEGIMQPAQAAGTRAAVSEAEAALVRTTASAVLGDLTGDGIVDFYDLLELAAQFERRGINLPADLDGDGTVTMDDLFELRSLYEFRQPRDPDAPENGAPGDEDQAAEESEEPLDLPPQEDGSDETETEED